MTAKRDGMQKLIFYSALCMLHWALVLVSPCSAQGPQTPAASPDSVPYDQRTDAFRRLLFELKFQPLASLPDLEVNPSESLFIMLGDLRALSAFSKGLRSFVEQGGAVLIATDIRPLAEAHKTLSELAGVTVTGKTLVVRHIRVPHVGPDILYGNLEYCPYLIPVEDANVLGAAAALIRGGGKPDLFRHYAHPDQPRLQVATNAPSYLELSAERLPHGIHRLARLPQVCQDENSDPNAPISSGKHPVVDEEGPLFAVGGNLGKGRVLVLADHSIFINRMILPHDTGNLEFAANCLHWLRGGVSTPMEGLRALNGPEALQKLAGQRNKVLFCEDSRVHTDFNVPLKKVPAPPRFASEPVIVAAIDKTIARLEESDSFNRALLDQIDEKPGGHQRGIRTAVYLLTLAALLLVSYRFLWRARHRPELAVPLLSKTLREHEPKASLLDQRRRALLRAGNVWEMGHRLARECFDSAGIALTDTTPPRVVMSQASRWQHWRINRRVARLWRLARGDSPRPLSPAALQYRLREIDELKTALTNGTIVLNEEGRFNHGLHG